MLRVHILTRWGAVKLADVTHEQIAGWIAELRCSGLSASTVRQIHRVFSLVLALAVRDGRLARNPADGVPLPRATRGEQVFLTHDRLDALADAAGRERLVIFFLGYTGVRYGEMVALRVRNLDLIKRRALIAEAVADVNGRAVFDTPKNHQRRAVPLPRFLADELAEYVAGKGPDDYVFAAEQGGVLHLRNFRRNSFDPAVRATALDLYGHLFADQLDQVADAMDAARSRVQDHADFLRTRPVVRDLEEVRQRARGQQLRGS
jgi:integrase